MNELQTLVDYFVKYPFVRYAFAVGLLIALCSSLLGVTLVLKRFSFIGDGLSHVAFGAMAVAAITGLTNKMVIILPVTLLSAILLLRTGQNTKIKGDDYGDDYCSGNESGRFAADLRADYLSCTVRNARF